MLQYPFYNSSQNFAGQFSNSKKLDYIFSIKVGKITIIDLKKRQNYNKAMTNLLSGKCPEKLISH